MLVALNSRLRGRDEPEFAFAPSAFPTVVIPDLIRDPERRAQLVRSALDTRLREWPGLTLYSILILRRRDSAVSKDALQVRCLQRAHPSRRFAPQDEETLA